MATTTTATTMTTTAAATARVSRAMRRLQRSSAARRAAIANAAAVPIATNAKRSVLELVDFFGGGKIHRRRPSTSSLSSGTSTSDSEWDEGEEFEDDDGCNTGDEEEASANKEDSSNAQEESVVAAGYGWTGVTVTSTVAASIAAVAAPTAAHVAMPRTSECGSYSQLGQSQSQSQSQNTPPTTAPAADLQYHQEQKQRACTQTRSTLECWAPSPTGTSAVASAVTKALWLFVNALVLVMAWLVTSFTTTKANDSSIVATPRTQLAASFSTESTGTTTTDTKRSAACYTGVSANRKTVSTVNSDDVATPAAKCTDSAQDQASSCTNVYDSLSVAANSTVGCVASASAATVTTTITITVPAAAVTTTFTDPVGRLRCKDLIGDDKQDHLHAACESEVISQDQIGGDEQGMTNVGQEAKHPAEITSQGQDGDGEQDETSFAQGAEDGVKDQVHERSDDEVDQDLDQDEDQVKGYDEDQDEDEARADVHQFAQIAAVAPSPAGHVQVETAEDHAEEDIQIRIQVDLHSESYLPEGENGDHAAPARASSEKSESKSESDIAAEPSDTVSTATQQQRPSRKPVRAVYMEYPSTERYQRHLLSTLGMRERVENLTSANLQQQQVLRHQQQQWRW